MQLENAHATCMQAVPTPRSNHSAVACGEHMLVFGGWSRDGSTPLAEPELLHLGTRSMVEGTLALDSSGAPPRPRGFL